MQLKRPPNTYSARIVRFADADTPVVLIEGSFNVWTQHYLRLIGIEAHELDGPHGDDARAIRDQLNQLLSDRGCLVHLKSHAHDRYGRLRGSITIGESDLANTLCSKGWAWPCTAEESHSQHALAKAATAAATLATTGCTVVRDGSTAIWIVGTNSIPGDISTRGSAQLAPHTFATALIVVVVLSAGAALIWLIHNRGKLAGLAAKITTGL